MPEPAEMSRSPEDPRRTPGSAEGGGSSVAGGGGGGGVSGEVNGHKAGGGGGGEADPFADYMWMENEEEYNRQVEEELLEQDFLERCFQEMLEEEEHDWFIPSRDYRPGAAAAGQLQNHFNSLSLADGSPEDIARKSNLNPEAKEFVPGVKY